MPADEVTLPTGGTPIEQPTIPYADDYNEQPTIPLTQDTFAATETVPTVNQPEWTEDDDHTVAFMMICFQVLPAQMPQARIHP